MNRIKIPSHFYKLCIYAYGRPPSDRRYYFELSPPILAFSCAMLEASNRGPRLLRNSRRKKILFGPKEISR